MNIRTYAKLLKYTYHFGRVGSGGIGGIGGSLMFGIELLRLPNRGLGGGNKFGVIPPLARGIYVGIVGTFENLSFNGTGGLCNSNEGILLELLGLFYASNLSAKVPCLSPPFVSFLTAYYTLICLPEKY